MDEDYRGQHQAPTDDGYSSPVSESLTRFGPDLLERPDLYGSADEETLQQLDAAIREPGTTVRIYRAVPPDHSEINHGDWVTLSRAYAHEHGYVDDGPDWPIVFADVPARHVWTDGNDPCEQGYNGPDLRGLHPYRERDTLPQALSAQPDPSTATATFTPSRGAELERRQPMGMSSCLPPTPSID